MSLARLIPAACLAIALASRALAAEPMAAADGNDLGLRAGQISAATSDAPSGNDNGPGIDVAALRTYAAHHDLEHVDAEIQRLRAKTPGWQPTPDFVRELETADLAQPLWELYGQHDYAGVRSRIARIEETRPDWRPPSHLMELLSLGEMRDRLVRAFASHAYAVVIKVAAADKALETCGDMDVMWRTAEAFVRLDDMHQALAAYTNILRNCQDPAARLATMQKAASLLKSQAAIDSLTALGQRDASGHDEFEALRLDSARTRIGAATDATGEAPSQASLDTLARRFDRKPEVDDAVLLGQSAYARKNLPEAEVWFKRALDLQPRDARATQGLALILRDADRRAEAEGSAAAPLPPARIAAFAQAVDTARSADGAQALGWFFYKQNRVVEAQDWFRKSAGWRSSETAAVGLLVCAARLGRRDEYAIIADRYRNRYASVARLEILIDAPAARIPRGGARAGRAMMRRPAPPPRGLVEGSDPRIAGIVSAFETVDFERTMSTPEQQRPSEPEPRGASILRGWALYHRGDWNGARTAFTLARSQGRSAEAEAGLRMIELSGPANLP